MSNVLYVINPAGHGGTGNNAWEAFKALWPNEINAAHAIFTGEPGQARQIAASVEGYDTFVAVGGDGTVGDVMSGIMDRQGSQPTLAIIPAGTGNDIARNVGIYSVEDAVETLREGYIRRFDLVRVDCQVDDQSVHKYSFLACCVGFSSIPMVKPWMKRFLGPKGAYFLGTFLQSIVYQAPHMTVRTAEREHNGRTWMVIVGNVERTAGGGMCLAPGARTDDGDLNITVFTAQSKLKLYTKLFPKVPTGAHIHEPGVEYFPGKRIEVDSTPPAILELDGDIFGTTPASFTVCPQALGVMSPGQPKKMSV